MRSEQHTLNDTTEIGAAFIRHVYAAGTLTLTEAHEALSVRCECSRQLTYHLEMALAHLTGVLPSYSDPHEAALVADPQTPEQREALAALAAENGSFSPDMRQAWWKVPYRFAPGMRRRFELERIPPCPSC